MADGKPTTDLQHLFSNPATDPQHLTWAAFEAKEIANFNHAKANLPAVVQPFVEVAEASLAPLAASVITVGGGALGGIVGTLAADLAAALAKALTSAGAQASVPAGQAAIQQIGSAAQTALAHLTAQAASGVIDLAASAQPAPAP